MAAEKATDHHDAKAKIQTQTKGIGQETGVEAAFSEIERSPTTDLSRLTPARIEVLQRLVGNQAVQRMISDIQRAPLTPAPAGGVTAPPPDAPKENPELEAILKRQYISIGDKFDLKYLPNGENPPTVRPIFGNALITLRIHIDFKDFGPEMLRQAPYNTYRFSREQKAQMRWADGEKAAFSTDLIKSVQDGWSAKHQLACIDPGLEELVAALAVKVELTDDAAKAHNKMTAQKVPEGAPRFRSFVQGNTSVLDSRDPSQNETSNRQRPIGNFEVDNDDPAALNAQMDAAVAEIKAFPPPSPENTAKPQSLMFVGNTDKTGARAHNEALGKRRAANVRNYVVGASGWAGKVEEDMAIVQKSGANDAKNRRVDIWMLNVTTQNVAAHEAGHMFGLGDEYPDADPGQNRAVGDQPSHYGDVKAEVGLGQGEADKLLVGDNNNMMSEGSQVQPGHYVYFLQKIESSTGKKWTVRD